MAEVWLRFREIDHIRCEPTPLPKIKELNTKYGYSYKESDRRQQLPVDRGVRRKRRGILR